MLLAIDRQVTSAGQDEQDAFGPGIRFRIVGAAARLDFNDGLAEGFGKAGERARENPGPSVSPVGQEARDDIRQNAARDDGIGVGEDCPPGQKLIGAGEPAGGGLIGRHSRYPSLSFALWSTIKP